MQLPNHGANPFAVYQQLGIERPTRVLDFSENVNPQGPPESVVAAWPTLLEKATAYPHPEGEPFLSEAAAFHHVSRDEVFIGNGAAELLALLAERYRGKRAVIVHPTFSEYEKTLQAKKVEITRVVASAETGFQLPVDEIRQAMYEADVLYVCTPNNPTGILPTSDTLMALIRHGKEVNCELVLDEAFIDFIDESSSFVPKINEFPHVIVVRSMTKMYAIPGIRLGYVVANPKIIEEVKAYAPHWNVNGIAAEIGTICLRENDFVQRAILHSNKIREEMKVFLQKNECIVTNSQANFLSFTLSENRSTRKLYVDLLKRGLVLRHSENFRGMDGQWLRIGMKKEEEMAVLKEELTQWFAEH